MLAFITDQRIELSLPSSMRHIVDGICGRSNLNIKRGETNRIKSCKYSKSSFHVLSNRIQAGSCPQLEPIIKKELEKEKGQCAKVDTFDFKVQLCFKNIYINRIQLKKIYTYM